MAALAPLYVEDRPSPVDLQLLEEQIIAYNFARTGAYNGRDLAIFVRDTGGALLAGISGYTWANFCEIKLLWVHEAARGQGYGARLLAAAEQEAINRGASLILLDSYSFQAPDFYLRHGYTCIGQIEGCPTGHTRFYFTKGLAPRP